MRLKPVIAATFVVCVDVVPRIVLLRIGVTTAVEVFNDIFDTFCPIYESEPESLSEIARVQVLRAIGVAIVKAGTMFPTLELLLRHAVNYLGMKKHKALSSGGIIDNEEDFIEDFDKITLDESRAVLSIHMLCYVLDGTIGFSELSLWQKLLDRVESLYEAEKEKFANYTVPELRHFIVERLPWLHKAIDRIPTGLLDATHRPRPIVMKSMSFCGCSCLVPGRSPDDPRLEKAELDDLVHCIDMPEDVCHFDQLAPRVICQQFRGNTPVCL